MSDFSDFNFKKLDESHSKIIQNFNCEEDTLSEFLKDGSALNQQSQLLSVTYLVFKKDELAGYFTILNDNIELDDESLKQWRANRIFYKTFPSLKIGRLARDLKFTGQGVGRLMIVSIVQKALNEICPETGCRFITVDALKTKENKYRRYMFKELAHLEGEEFKDTTLMYIDLMDVSNSLNLSD